MEDNKSKLVDKIVLLEWDAFDKVRNEGGRAFCQNDWGTFSIMRKSQYLTWTEKMLLQYAGDFEEANNKGLNMISEKYARMMESTTPDHYEKLKDFLPVRDDKQKAITEEIIAIQIGWMEDFAHIHPALAQNARTIHTKDDTPFDTSYETYLRGELLTYSEEMIGLYGRFIARLAVENKNLARMIMENTVHFYGYENLEDAEKKITHIY